MKIRITRSIPGRVSVPSRFWDIKIIDTEDLPKYKDEGWIIHNDQSNIQGDNS